MVSTSTTPAREPHGSILLRVGFLTNMAAALTIGERERKRRWYHWISKLMDARSRHAEAGLEVVVPTPASADDASSSPVIYRYVSPDTPTLSDSIKRRQRPKRKLWLIVMTLFGLALAIGIIIKVVIVDGDSAAKTSTSSSDAPKSEIDSTRDGQSKSKQADQESRSNDMGSGASMSGSLEAGVNPWTPPSRVRRTWKSYTDDEKKLYLSAVQIGMEKGFHYRFVEIHTARMNKLTSHGSCAFLLWHRRFILGYENMLRSLSPEFANLTLPYWNYFEDTNRQLASATACNSLESCSQFLRDMGGGGTSDGPSGQNLTIGPVEVRIGTCVSKGIAGHACDHPNGVASGLCHNCVMRGNWSNPHKIVETLGPDLLSVLNVFNTTPEAESFEGAHGVLSHRIENSFHNAIHNTLNSTMRYTSSPFDPIFIGHHGMVDLTQFIVNRCKYVADPSIKIDSATDERSTRFDVFTQCDIEDDDEQVLHTALGSEAMQMTMYDVPVEQEEIMKWFFSGFGNKYSDLANAEDLGPLNSYTYAIDPYMQQLLESHNVKCPDYLYAQNNAKTARRRLRERDPDQVAAIELANTLASCGTEVQATHPNINYQQRLEIEGLIKCLVVEQRVGGQLNDYDAEFRAMMRIPDTDSTYCVSLLRRHRQGTLPMLASDHCLRRYGELTGVDLVSLMRR